MSWFRKRPHIKDIPTHIRPYRTSTVSQKLMEQTAQDHRPTDTNENKNGYQIRSELNHVTKN